MRDRAARQQLKESLGGRITVKDIHSHLPVSMKDAWAVLDTGSFCLNRENTVPELDLGGQFCLRDSDGSKIADTGSARQIRTVYRSFLFQSAHWHRFLHPKAISDAFLEYAVHDLSGHMATLCRALSGSGLLVHTEPCTEVTMQGDRELVMDIYMHCGLYSEDPVPVCPLVRQAEDEAVRARRLRSKQAVAELIANGNIEVSAPCPLGDTGTVVGKYQK